MLEITPQELKAKLDGGAAVHLLDVREQQELAICEFEGAEHIPMMSLFLGLKKTGAAQEAEVVVVCHTGVRSLEAAQFLRMQGFPNAKSLAGGIDAWAVSIDPSLARY